MKKLGSWLRNLFIPPKDSPKWIRTSTVFFSAVVFMGILTAGAYGWEYTNSPDFCGTGCHSMPPEFTSYQQSPHSEIKCVECHIGRDFIGNQLTRKMGDIRHVIAHVSGNYEYPIHVKTLRPAEEVCEECHNPNKFSDNSHREIPIFAPDEMNTPSTVYLNLNTGGGSPEDGFGKGIHWHVQNPVWFYATDKFEQDIPYVKVIDEENGIEKEYIDIFSGISSTSIDDSELVQMDCITCHNRISHSIPTPEEAVNSAMSRGLISTDIPEIRLKSVEILKGGYATQEEGVETVRTITQYYKNNHADFYNANTDLVNQAVDVLVDIYEKGSFPEQKVEWDTHADNLGHTTSPGCFRCHDGEHFAPTGQSVPQECNTCHAIPVVSGPEDEVTQLTITHIGEPETHQNTNWMVMHQYMYDPEDPDEACSGCHDTTAYDTGDNVSFCSNSMCHGSVIEIARIEDISSQSLTEKILLQFPHYPALLSEINPWSDIDFLESRHLNYEGDLVDEPIVCTSCHEEFPPSTRPSNDKCLACHGETITGLQEITSDWDPNPHDQHEGNVSCEFCHSNFGPEVEACALCHENEPMTPIGETSGN